MDPIRKHLPHLAAFGLVSILASAPVFGQGSDAARASKPLADMAAFNIQTYYVSKLTGLEDRTADDFFLRYAKPLQTRGGSTWLLRSRCRTGGCQLRVTTSRGSVTWFSKVERT